jgi:RNA polymerase sigma-70 factor (ECF subfamily)
MLNNDNDDLSPFAKVIIRRKARLLVGRVGFTEQDREDLEQELALRLLRSLRLFNPERGHVNIFITTIVDREGDRILRERLTKKRYGGAVTMDIASNGELNDPRPSDQCRVDMANDMAEVMKRLPDDLYALAERLKIQPVSRASRDLGVPRRTLRDKVRRLRRCFEHAGLKIYLETARHF